MTCCSRTFPRSCSRSSGWMGSPTAVMDSSTRASGPTSAARLAVAMGDRGGLTLFGSRAEQHRLLAEHLTAEYRVKTEGRGRVVDEWKQRPERGDNHWFDGLVGCAVAASLQGVTLPGTEAVRSLRSAERLSLAEYARRARQKTR